MNKTSFDQYIINSEAVSFVLNNYLLKKNPISVFAFFTLSEP